MTVLGYLLMTVIIEEVARRSAARRRGHLGEPRRLLFGLAHGVTAGQLPAEEGGKISTCSSLPLLLAFLILPWGMNHRQSRVGLG